MGQIMSAFGMKTYFQQMNVNKSLNMSVCTGSVLTDQEVHDSITNIALWLQTHSHAGPQQTPEEIGADDLAIAVPGECLFPELLAENEEASHEDEKGILVYTDSSDDKYIWLCGDWHSLDKILSITSTKSGWVRTSCLGDRLLVLILTQLDYAARESEAEVPYGCCPLSDPTYLLWHQGRPNGMASIKRKGTSIWGGEDTYVCDTLDTLYVRQRARRQGYSLGLIRMLSSELPPGEHLGLSHPVSLSMCKVLLKFIHMYPSLKDNLWTLDEDGEVSGTVSLMLGSLMMRGALRDAGVTQPSHALECIVQPMDEQQSGPGEGDAVQQQQQPMDDVTQTMESSVSLPEKTPQQTPAAASLSSVLQQKSSTPQVQEAEPCDES